MGRREDLRASREAQPVLSGAFQKILLIICICFAVLCSPAVLWAAPSEGAGVYDYYGLLDSREEEELDEILRELREEYQFDGAVLITDDVWEDDRHYAAEFMQEHEIGYGREKNGMCLFHQPDSRSITVVFRGMAQETFDQEVQDVILDDCIEYLREDDFYQAYREVLDDLEKGLKRFSKGKSIRPMDLGGPGMGLFLLYSLAGSFLVMAIPTFGIVWFQKSRMHTLVPQPNADFYAPEDGVELDRERDLYVRTATTRTRIPKQSSGGGNGGGGGNFKAGGESFSGSSRKY